MKRLLLTTVLLIPVCAPVHAQKSQTPQTPQAQVVKPEPKKDASASIREGLNDVFGQLSQSLKDADALAGRLKDMAAKTSGDVANQITQAEETMGNLADKLGPEGSLSGELRGLRDAAQKHLERVQKLPGEFLDDEDRTRLLNSWQKVIQDADSASGNMSMMREQTGTALMKLQDARRPQCRKCCWSINTKRP